MEVSQRSAREGSEGAAGWVRPVCSVHFRKIRITRRACDQGKQGRSQNKKGGSLGQSESGQVMQRGVKVSEARSKGLLLSSEADLCPVGKGSCYYWLLHRLLAQIQYSLSTP